MLSLHKLLPVTVLLFVASIAWLSAEATAGELRIPLPELLGSYERNDLGFGNTGIGDPEDRSTRVVSGIPIYWVSRFSIELEGVLSFGEAVGDGRFREPERITLPGGFAPSVAVGNSVLAQFHSGSDDEEGAFQRKVSFLGSDVEPPYPNEPQRFDPIIRVSLLLGALADIPYVNPPQDPISQPDPRGVLVTTPLRGEITSAFLVIQTDSIPEPSAIALCGLAVVFATTCLNRQRGISSIASG